MDRVSRRSFIAAGAGVGAAAVVGTAVPAGASEALEQLAVPDHQAIGAADGVVIHVRDASKGELVIMGPESEVTVTNRRLVAALGRAAKSGKQV